MSKIAFIAYNNCLASSICLPIEMFNAALDAQQALRRTGGQSKAIYHSESVIEVYGRKRQVLCAGSASLSTNAHPKEIDGADLIILPAIWRNPLPVIAQNRYLVELVREWHRQGVMLCAVGTGSCFFAEAGLLNQRPATSHWRYFDSFQKRYPEVQLQKDFLITQAGNLYCAGSVNAVADLVIHFIERLFGVETAKRVESNFSPEVRQSYASNMFIEGKQSNHSDEDMIRLTHWLNENFAEKVTAEKMAEMLGISVRTLNRRFKTATQQTPVEYLRVLRHRHAKDLLKNTNLSVGEVAIQIGYNDSSYFCREFKKLESVTAAGYKASIRGKLFS